MEDTIEDRIITYVSRGCHSDVIGPSECVVGWLSLLRGGGDQGVVGVVETG